MPRVNVVEIDKGVAQTYEMIRATRGDEEDDVVVVVVVVERSIDRH